MNAFNIRKNMNRIKVVFIFMFVGALSFAQIEQEASYKSKIALEAGREIVKKSCGLGAGIMLSNRFSAYRPGSLSHIGGLLASGASIVSDAERLVSLWTGCRRRFGEIAAYGFAIVPNIFEPARIPFELALTGALIQVQPVVDYIADSVVPPGDPCLQLEESDWHKCEGDYAFALKSVDNVFLAADLSLTTTRLANNLWWISERVEHARKEWGEQRRNFAQKSHRFFKQNLAPLAHQSASVVTTFSAAANFAVGSWLLPLIKVPSSLVGYWTAGFNKDPLPADVPFPPPIRNFLSIAKLLALWTPATINGLTTLGTGLNLVNSHPGIAFVCFGCSLIQVTDAGLLLATTTIRTQYTNSFDDLQSAHQNANAFVRSSEQEIHRASSVLSSGIQEDKSLNLDPAQTQLLCDHLFTARNKLSRARLELIRASQAGQTCENAYNRCVWVATGMAGTTGFLVPICVLGTISIATLPAAVLSAAYFSRVAYQNLAFLKTEPESSSSPRCLMVIFGPSQGWRSFLMIGARSRTQGEITVPAGESLWTLPFNLNDKPNVIPSQILESITHALRKVGASEALALIDSLEHFSKTGKLTGTK